MKNNDIKLTLEKKLPTKEGYYWFCDFGEHTPTVVEVRRHKDVLYAYNEEFHFTVAPSSSDENDDFVDKPFRYGDELWCRIPNPFLPTGKRIEPNSY